MEDDLKQFHIKNKTIKNDNNNIKCIRIVDKCIQK